MQDLRESVHFGIVEVLIGERTGFAYQFQYEAQAGTGQQSEALTKLESALSDNPFTSGHPLEVSGNPKVNKFFDSLLHFAKSELEAAAASPEGYRLRQLEEMASKLGSASAHKRLHEFHEYPTDFRPVKPEECVIVRY